VTASPSTRLFVGLGLSLATIGGVGLYTVREIRALRDEQTAISERNRKDSLQLLRIQNNLARLATTMRDMADRVEPYPLVSWQQIFDRLRVDLSQAIALEKTLAPAERPAAQQERLLAAVDRFWGLVDEMFRVAASDENAAIGRLRTSVSAQHMELVGMVSQFLVLNNRVQEEAAQQNQAIYDRVVREIAVLVAALLVVVALTFLYIIRANRRAFDEVERLSAQLRNLSWRMLRLQEDLQQEFARELHDEFGQIFTAVGTLLGRVTRNLPPDSPLVGDLEEVRQIAQQTLEKIRVQSRLLHPVILDDFGLEKALEWFVEQFGRQHGINARFETQGPIGVVPPESTIHIYRIVQEALTNISRHAQTRDAWVRLSQRNGILELEVEDRGKGLADRSPEAVQRGIGLVSMRERAELMGGTFALRSGASGGLVVSVRVPIGAGRARAADAARTTGEAVDALMEKR
jgi:signal transduction histidine kinase